MKTELLACFAEDGSPLPDGVPRDIAHREGILHGAAHVYLYCVEEGRVHILLQRRSETKDSFPGCLDTSSAGHMEAGMDFRATAKKELWEELGIALPDGDLHEAFRFRCDTCDRFHGEEFHNREIFTVYFAKIKKDTVFRLQSEEVSEVLWKSGEEILQGQKDGNKEFCMNPEAFARILEAIRTFEGIR